MFTMLRKAVRSGQSGQAIVLIALAMVALIAIIILAIDGGRYFDQRRRAQNAADMASLSGLYQAQHGGTAANGDNLASDYYVVAQINHTAESNAIPDTDTTLDPDVSTATGSSYAGDASNGNVKAYWINSAGDYVCATTPYTVMTGTGSTEPPQSCALIPADKTLTQPSAATGIKIRVQLTYTTFTAHLMGMKNTYAQADGTALTRSGVTSYPPTECGSSGCAIYAGGGMCTTATNPAIYWGGTSANNTDWGGGVFANGYLYIDQLTGGMPNTINKHNNGGKIIAVDTPQTQYDGTHHGYDWPSGEVPNPSGDAAGTFTTPYNFYGQGSSLAVRPKYPFSDWAYLHANQFAPNIPPSTLSKPQLQIQAWFFKPYALDINTTLTGGPDVVDTPKSISPQISNTAAVVPPGHGANNWIFKGTELNINPSDSSAPQKNFFHYIKDIAQGTRTAAQQNGYDFEHMVSQGDTGIFFIDGDLETTLLWADGITVVATGTIHVNINGNNKVGNAGVYAFGMSILAGGSKSGTPPTDPNTACAGGIQAADWILHFEGQQNGWDGIVYVPNGLFWIDTDYHSSVDPVGPIVAWSQATAVVGSHPGNNFQFNTCVANCFPQPTYVMGLQQ
jgi:Flp pilus assembly protein TadG